MRVQEPNRYHSKCNRIQIVLHLSNDPRTIVRSVDPKMGYESHIHVELDVSNVQVHKDFMKRVNLGSRKNCKFTVFMNCGTYVPRSWDPIRLGLVVGGSGCRVKVLKS